LRGAKRRSVIARSEATICHCEERSDKAIPCLMSRP
jgi:hypothetical protein